jgi:predicted lipoprotein with Yx(FWY)xxD motif
MNHKNMLVHRLHKPAAFWRSHKRIGRSELTHSNSALQALQALRQVRAANLNKSVGVMVLFSLVLSACAPMAAQSALNAPAIYPTATGASPAAAFTAAPAAAFTAAPAAAFTAAPAAAPTAAAPAPTASSQPSQPPAAMPTTAGPSPTAAAPQPTTTIPTAATMPLESKKNPKLGKLLATAGGWTLYTFAKDSAGVSACTSSPCSDFWPALTVKEPPTAEPDVKGALGSTTRPDGSMQVTFNGMPLYTFTQDKAPGDANGDGLNDFGGVWHAVSLGSAPKQNPPAGGGMGGGGYHYP